MTAPRPGARVLGTFVDAVDEAAACRRIAGWAAAHESRVVFLCNVHSVVSADRDADFATILGAADLALADGAPVAWMLRRLGYPAQRRVAGPDLMWRCCALAAERGLAVFFYGADEATLACLRTRLTAAFPGLAVAGALAPPFRPLTPDEDATVVARIRDAAPAIVFVGLGCPKQEAWMAAHRGRIAAVMIGVGAAFDFHAGTRRRAPSWMRRLGLEWLHRLASEPRRLGTRYLVTNTGFVVGAIRQMLRRGRNSG